MRRFRGSLEHLTADNWHDMAEADATLLVRLAATPTLNDEKRGELVRAAERLRFYAYWARSYTLAVMTIRARHESGQAATQHRLSAARVSADSWRRPHWYDSVSNFSARRWLS